MEAPDVQAGEPGSIPVEGHVLQAPPPADADMRQQLDDFLQTLRTQSTRKVYKRGPDNYARFWDGQGHPNVQINAQGVAQFLSAYAHKGYYVLNSYMKGLVDFQKALCKKKGVPIGHLRQDRHVSDVLQEAKRAVIIAKASAKATATGSGTEGLKEGSGSGKDEDSEEGDEPEEKANAAEARKKGGEKAKTLDAATQLREVSKFWLNTASGLTKRPDDFAEYVSLQIRARFLLFDKALGYAETIAKADLPDMFHYELQSVGPDEANVLAILANNGKTTRQDGRGFVGFLRTRDYIVCPVSAVALAFFSRWEIMNRRLPNFSTRASWYPTPLLEGRVEDLGICYNTEYTYVKMAYQSMGLQLESRTSVAKTMDAKAQTVEWIQHGSFFGNPWNLSDWTETKRTGYPFMPMTYAAGFSHEDDSYVLPRSRVMPSTSMSKLIWPWVDDELERQEQSNLGSLHDRDLSAVGFLQVLLWLRTVLLQDAALMQRDFPSLPIFTHPVFAHPDWLPFSAEVRQIHDETPTKPVAPLPFATEVSNLREQVRQTMAGVGFVHGIGFRLEDEEEPGESSGQNAQDDEPDEARTSSLFKGALEELAKLNPNEKTAEEIKSDAVKLLRELQGACKGLLTDM